jgi:type I restriction enzyme S subunit
MEQVLYALPDGWKWQTFNDVCTNITDGAHASPKTADEGFPYVTVRDVNHKGKIDIINCKRISEGDFLSLKKGNCLPPIDSVLLSKDGTVGKVAHVTSDYDEFVVLSSLAIIVPEKTYLSPEYLKYFLLSPEFQEHAIGSKTGAAIKRIVLRTIKNFNIPIAPLEQQKRIVEKLDALLTRIDSALEHLQESVTLADALYASTINEQMMQAIELVGLSTVEKHIAQIQTGTTPPTKQPEFYENADINWFAPSDFGEHDILSDSNKKLSQKAFEVGKARKFSAGTIMLVAIGATIGKIGYLEQDASSNQQITGMKFNSDIIPRYAYYWFRFVKPEILANASTATLPIINQKGIKALPFCAPNKQLQTAICKKIDEVSNFRNTVKAELNDKVKLMRSLKASILNHTFKGQL